MPDGICKHCGHRPVEEGAPVCPKCLGVKPLVHDSYLDQPFDFSWLGYTFLSCMFACIIVFGFKSCGL